MQPETLVKVCSGLPIRRRASSIWSGRLLSATRWLARVRKCASQSKSYTTVLRSKPICVETGRRIFISDFVTSAAMVPLFIDRSHLRADRRISWPCHLRDVLRISRVTGLYVPVEVSLQSKIGTEVNENGRQPGPVCSKR